MLLRLATCFTTMLKAVLHLHVMGERTRDSVEKKCHAMSRDTLCRERVSEKGQRYMERYFIRFQGLYIY